MGKKDRFKVSIEETILIDVNRLIDCIDACSSDDMWAKILSASVERLPPAKIEKALKESFNKFDLDDALVIITDSKLDKLLDKAAKDAVNRYKTEQKELKNSAPTKSKKKSAPKDEEEEEVEESEDTDESTDEE